MPTFVPIHACSICGTQFTGSTIAKSKHLAEKCELEGMPKFKYQVGFEFKAAETDLDTTLNRALQHVLNVLFEYNAGEDIVKNWIVKEQCVGLGSPNASDKLTHLAYYRVVNREKELVVSQKLLTLVVNRLKDSTQRKTKHPVEK